MVTLGHLYAPHIIARLHRQYIVLEDIIRATKFTIQDYTWHVLGKECFRVDD